MEVPDPGWGGRGSGEVHDSDSAVHDRGQTHTGGKGSGRGEKLGHGERNKATTNQSRARQSESKKKKSKKKWTDVEILVFGLSLVGFESSRQQVREELNIRRFRSHYGVGPKAIEALIKDLNPIDSGKVLDDIIPALLIRIYKIKHQLLFSREISFHYLKFDTFQKKYRPNQNRHQLVAPLSSVWFFLSFELALPPARDVLQDAERFGWEVATLCRVDASALTSCIAQ